MLRYNREAAAAHLRRADPVLARIIDAIGPLTLEPRDGCFRSLSRAIFFQQLAGPAARAIMNRVLALLGADEEHWFSPEQLLAADDGQLRGAGLSRQKVVYLRDLAAKFAAGELSEQEFAQPPDGPGLDDEEVIRRVSRVKGIGRWTGEMFLIFTLGRADVLPVDDLGVRRAMQIAYALAGLPKAEEMRAIAEPWRPYRSAGTWYMWRSLGVQLPEDGR